MWRFTSVAFRCSSSPSWPKWSAHRAPDLVGDVVSPVPRSHLTLGFESPGPPRRVGIDGDDLPMCRSLNKGPAEPGQRTTALRRSSGSYNPAALALPSRSTRTPRRIQACFFAGHRHQALACGGPGCTTPRATGPKPSFHGDAAFQGAVREPHDVDSGPRGRQLSHKLLLETAKHPSQSLAAGEKEEAKRMLMRSATLKHRVLPAELEVLKSEQKRPCSCREVETRKCGESLHFVIQSSSWKRKHIN